MDGQKRKKSYYSINHNHQKKRRRYNLEAGMKGFFCTSNFHEKDCVREAYNILNEFADNLFGSEKTAAAEVTEHDNLAPESSNIEIITEDSQEVKGDEDISVALSKEVADLKAELQKPSGEHRFQAVDAGVKSIVFIQSNIPDPLELALSIIKELDDSKKARTRFLMRLLPVEVVCKAYMDDITSNADTVFEKYFTQEPKTFCIVFNRHSNHDVQRNHVIEDLAEIIAKKNPGNKVDLKNPEIAVVVEVIRGLCLISVAPHYYKYKKYNLLEICGAKESDKQNARVDIDKFYCNSRLQQHNSITQENLLQVGKNFPICSLCKEREHDDKGPTAAWSRLTNHKNPSHIMHCFS